MEDVMSAYIECIGMENKGYQLQQSLLPDGLSMYIRRDEGKTDMLGIRKNEWNDSRNEKSPSEGSSAELANIVQTQDII